MTGSVAPTERVAGPGGATAADPEADRGSGGAAETFEGLKARRGLHQRADLDAYFATLEPVQVETMIGSWQGGVFKVGSSLEVLLKDFGLIKWWGKRFDSADRVQALVGKTLGAKMWFPLGTAVLRRVEFRGQVSAAMIYDRRPIIDHFRRITDDAVMGIMDQRGKIKIYFYLERE